MLHPALYLPGLKAEVSRVNEKTPEGFESSRGFFVIG